VIGKLENLSVSKSAITRAFIVAIALIVAGFVGSVGIGIWALVNGAIAFGGAQVVTVDPSPLAGAIVGLVVASVVTAIGTALAVVAWGGALLNTVRLEDKAWFIAVLVLGLISLGWVALFAYVVYGPDSTQTPRGVAA
jgi:hypothetical protein